MHFAKDNMKNLARCLPHLLVCWVALSLLAASTAPLQAQIYGESDGDVVVEHYPCYTPANFFSPRNPAYYEYKDTGIYFDPNPFQLSSYLGGTNYWAEMLPITGRRDLYSVNKSGKVWKSPSITVECFIRRTWTPFGQLNQPFMVIRSENGYIADAPGCSPDESTIYQTSYDPSDPSGPNTCSGPTEEEGSGSTGAGMNCHFEYVIIEVSYDGGKTWSTYWEGYANVCE